MPKMYIQTEATPNPETLKFLPGRDVSPTKSYDYRSAEDALRAPLAKRLFDIEGVEGVFLGFDFITITKSAGAEWDTLKALVLSTIMEHVVSGLPIVEEVTSQDDTDDDPVVVQIKALLETRVQPAVAQDGGNIVFDRFEDGVLYLHMQGACAGCPSASATLKSGIENMMRHYIPEVESVEAVNL